MQATSPTTTQAVYLQRDLAACPSQAREARKYLADLNHRQRLDKLELIFSAWRQRTPVSQQFANDYSQLLSMQDRLIAKALSTFRQLGRATVSALRGDDIRFFQALLRSLED